jgi:predicted ester cyclase
LAVDQPLKLCATRAHPTDSAILGGGMAAESRNQGLVNEQESHKEIIRAIFLRGLNKGDTTVYDEAVHPDFVLYAPTLDEPGHGPEAIKEFVRGLRAGFPDIEVSIDEILAERDLVSIRFRTIKQTHLGRYLAIPPTGRAIRMTGMGMFRFLDGRVVETRLELDALGGVQQLGVVPPNRIGTPARIAFILGSLFRLGFLEFKQSLPGRGRDGARSRDAD